MKRKNDKMHIYKKGSPALVKISIHNNGEKNLFKNGDYAWCATQERFYQNQAFQSNNQGNYQAPPMTEQQVINDAQQSGGSVNQFEAQNINAGGNNNTPAPPKFTYAQQQYEQDYDK